MTDYDRAIANFYTCRVCKLTSYPGAVENANWEVQYLTDNVWPSEKFLTCHICKTLPSSDYFEILRKERMT